MVRSQGRLSSSWVGVVNLTHEGPGADENGVLKAVSLSLSSRAENRHETRERERELGRALRARSLSLAVGWKKVSSLYKKKGFRKRPPFHFKKTFGCLTRLAALIRAAPVDEAMISHDWARLRLECAYMNSPESLVAVHVSASLCVCFVRRACPIRTVGSVLRSRDQDECVFDLVAGALLETF